MGGKGKSTDKQCVLRGQRKFKNEPHFIQSFLLAVAYLDKSTARQH